MLVKLYSTKTCAYCIMEKQYLEQKGVEFQQIFVDEDHDAAQEMIEISGQRGVPFTIIEKDNGEQVHILGFNQPKINEVLGIKT